MFTWKISITLCLWTLVSGISREFRRERISKNLDVLATFRGFRSSLECATKFGQERHKNENCFAYSFHPESLNCVIYKRADTSPTNDLVVYKYIINTAATTTHQHVNTELISTAPSVSTTETIRHGPIGNLVQVSSESYCDATDGFEQVLMDDRSFCYAYIREHKSYPNAQKHCLALGAYLLNFDDNLEREAVKTLHHGYWWVGANDIENEGQWISEKDGTPIIREFWPPWSLYNEIPEPSNREDEDCIMLWTGFSFFWLLDTICDAPSEFICEKTP